MPKVSVLCAVFNHERYLAQAIESVLRQTYEDWELILWDDGSSDQSLNIAKSYQEKFPNRIRVFWHPDHANRGQEYTRNQAAKASTGEFLCLLDSDDGFFPEKLEVLLPPFSDPEVGLVYGKAKIRLEPSGREIDPKISHYPSGKVHSKLLEENFIGAATVLFRRSCLFREGDALEFDTKYKTCGEYPLWLSIAEDWKIFHVSKVVAWWRFHGKNQSAKYELEAKEELARLFEDLSRSDPENAKLAGLVRRRKYDWGALQYAHLQFSGARQVFAELIFDPQASPTLKAKALALFAATFLGRSANTRLAQFKKAFWKLRNPFEALRSDQAS